MSSATTLLHSGGSWADANEIAWSEQLAYTTELLKSNCFSPSVLRSSIVEMNEEALVGLGLKSSGFLSAWMAAYAHLQDAIPEREEQEQEQGHEQEKPVYRKVYQRQEKRKPLNRQRHTEASDCFQRVGPRTPFPKTSVIVSQVPQAPKKTQSAFMALDFSDSE